MSQITTDLNCTGCSACASICPRDAISLMPKGSLGHLYPVIDEDKCINCNICEKTCPALSPIKLKDPITAYASWAKDEDENKKSSSGGVASVLARKVLVGGGVVYGCANIGMDVKHVRIDKVEDIELLRGSKYVQSTMGQIMEQVKCDIIKGIRVLFVGTPCQCAGLKAYLRKDYDNLVTVDLICHGTPSIKLLQEHILSKIDIKQNVEHISFRDGSNFSLTVKNTEGELIYQSNLWKQRYHDAYYNSFIEGYTFRPSCYKCLYARLERCTDITIGDFWGLGNKKSFIPLAKAYGYSVVLPNTEKGHTTLADIADSVYLQEREVEEAVSGNPQLRSPKSLSLNAKVFQWLFAHGVSLKISLIIADWYKVPAHLLMNMIRKRW